MLAPVVTICLTNRSGSHGPHKHPESQAWLTCQCQGLSTRGPRRTPQGHRPLPSALDVWLAGACNRPRPIRLFRCHSSTIAPLTATRTLDRMVLRQWAAAQKLAPGLRSGMSVCRLMAEESADAMAAASGLHESAQSTLAIVSRRPVPESAIGARAWRSDRPWPPHRPCHDGPASLRAWRCLRSRSSGSSRSSRTSRPTPSGSSPQATRTRRRTSSGSSGRSSPRCRCRSSATRRSSCPPSRRWPAGACSGAGPWARVDRR